MKDARVEYIEKFLCKKCIGAASSNKIAPTGDKESEKIDTKPSFHTEEELIGYLLIIDLLFEFLMIFWFPLVVAFLEIYTMDADIGQAIGAAIANIILQLIPEVFFTYAIFLSINMHVERVKKEILLLEPWFLTACLCAFGGAVALSMYGVTGNMLRDENG